MTPTEPFRWARFVSGVLFVLGSCAIVIGLCLFFVAWLGRMSLTDSSESMTQVTQYAMLTADMASCRDTVIQGIIWVAISTMMDLLRSIAIVLYRDHVN
jgi:hypothetical protein